MSLSEKHKRTIRELLDSGKLNEWETNALTDINTRDDNNQLHRVTPKMEAMFDKLKRKYIDGEDVKDDKGPRLPTEYKNCKVTRKSDGYFIEIEGTELGAITTKGEGVVIIEWLSRALDEIKEIYGGNIDDLPYDTPEEKPKTESKSAPF